MCFFREPFRQALLLLLLFLLSLFFGSEARATQLHLTWIDRADNEDGFEIERKREADEEFLRIAVVGTDVTTFTDSGLTPETTYCYRARAFNLVEHSDYSNTACATASTLVAAFESPDDGQPVSGIRTIHGWTFDTQVGSQISHVELFIDGKPSGEIPCCSERGDVLAAFPDFPAANTLQSGWGAIINWGLLSAGFHSLRLEITSTSGASVSTATQTVSVIKPANFEFLDVFALSSAEARIEGNELVLAAVIVRDSETLQERAVDVRFRWFESSQSFGMVEALTTAELSSVRSPLFAGLPTWLKAKLGMAIAHAASGIAAVFENPVGGQTSAGVDIMSGWAVPLEPEASIAEIRLVVNGLRGGTIPCCSSRGDVAAVFPSQANAAKSGWGTIFNYGLLEPGLHTIRIEIRDTLGNLSAIEREITVVKLGGFEFLDQFDLSTARAWIDGEEIVLEGVRVRDKTNQWTADVDLRLRWFTSSQTLRIVSSNG